MKGESEMNGSSPKLSAYTAYRAMLFEARKTAQAILEEIDRGRAVPRDTVDWGHVGSMNHVGAELKEILRFMRGEEE